MAYVQSTNADVVKGESPEKNDWLSSSKVGAYLKTPRYPIWVVCSESHFSVLFGLQRELLTNEGGGMEFDLYYFDGLANQQEEIRLTVSVGRLSQSSQDVETDLTPPLELCIRTRWKDAFVSWNDTEPIL